MMMDPYTKNALWDYWKKGDDQEVLSDLEETYVVDEDEIAKIFRIKSDIFDYEMPLCKAFNEFNYLFKIESNLLTNDNPRFKTYDEFKNEWINKWNKGIPWVLEEPWSEHGIPTDDIYHILNLSVSWEIKMAHFEEKEKYEEDRCKLLGNPSQESPVCKIGRSRFLRYIDTKPNGGGLKKSILSGPYVPTTVLAQAVVAAEGRPAVPQHTSIETILNMTPENIEHFQSKKEAIFLLLTGIGDEIYSTVDACNTANEMWIAIERLQQGESLNVQDVKTNLFWEFGKFTSRDGETMESYYSRYVTVVKQSKEIDTISYHTLFDILKQYQNEVNDIRAERIAKSANPLALLAAAQPYSDNYYQAPKPQRSNATSSSTRPSASTKHKGKEIAKPVTPQSESVSVSDKDSDPEQAQRDKEMQKNLALLAKYFKKLYKPTNN
ncbi:hypothetical protein Tco_0736515, partial [Tanacetum coccineum]